VAKGTEAEEAEIKAADAKFKPALDEAADHDKLARDISFGGDSDTGVKGNVTYETKSGEIRKLGHMSLSDRQAGLNATLRYGGGSNVRYVDYTLDQLNNGSAEERVMAERYRNANAQALLTKMKHVYFSSPPGPGQSRQDARDASFDRAIDNGISESLIAAMDSVEMEGMLESLSHRAAAGDADSARRLSTVLSTYHSAINNPNIRPNIGIGVSKAVEAFVDGQNEDELNANRAKLGLPGIDRTAGAHSSVAPIVASLRGRIDESGRIMDAVSSQAPPRPQSSGTFPAPSSTEWRPNTGTSTGGFEGEINIEQPGTEIRPDSSDEDQGQPPQQ
jgi:hypothetical protein